MTSRPNVGQRPPPRSLSANLLQRPAAPPSPSRRNHDTYADVTFDGPDAVLPRYGLPPKMAGSRLKLETSRDSQSADIGETAKSSTLEVPPIWRHPRGRPQLHFDVPSISNPGPRAAQDGDRPDGAINPMPLPIRPGHHPRPTVDRPRGEPANAQKKDSRPKPYTLEVPAAAARYSQNGYADFFPWTGNHPEDKFSENAIRQGFYDKAQLTQNETGSGKSSILPPLKHKSGLQTLSSLFTNVLAQRRAHGQITSNSTFKPPPRVTVTDTKREMWLKDLANPTISLRRLSRSIPHGIRGKVLLDQSLSKNIPIERAVWLAKCVGANELRSFRRKGASGLPMVGEAKWIREFTVCVEQFVESIVETCGDKDFRGRVNYALRLAAQFHSEHLLDRDHYLDWLVSALENCPQAKLPIWLLITQIYWKDILKSRKFGRRLSAALLSQWAQTLVHPDVDILAPLSDRLKMLLKQLMTFNPESFISSKAWAAHRAAITSTLAAEDARFAAILSSIDRRNGRFILSDAEKNPSPRTRLILLLDTTFSKPFTGDLLENCWRIDDDKDMLLRTILEWSTSSYRPGTAKIYVAARLFRHSAMSGTDITQAILSFLDSDVCEIGRSKSALYHLVSELSRSEHFSIPMYLQWLIARGGLYNAAEVSWDGPCATRLLVELPTYSLTESMDALRRTLLSRAGYSTDDEDELARAYMARLSKRLPGMQASMDSELETEMDIANDGHDSAFTLSRGNMSEVGMWLRQKVGLQMLQPTIPPLDNWDDTPMKGGTSAITLSDFHIVRHTLEDIQDFSILADVLKIVSSSNDAEVLASCTDTVNLHLDSFAAIGAVKGLFEILTSRLQSLAEDDSFPRVLLVSLSQLAARIPGQDDVARKLVQELSRSDRKTAADACSPVSDHMVGVTQTTEADFNDEIEKVLASGNSMDQATLERLFQRIMNRLEETWEKPSDQYRSCGLLLTRLRAFDPQPFDVLMTAWVARFFQMEHRPSMARVLGPLISFGCVSLQDVTMKSISMVEADTLLENHTQSRLSEEALALLVDSSDNLDTMTSEEVYRLRIYQTNMQRDRPLDILSVIRRSLTAESNDTMAKFGAPQSEKSNPALHEFLERLVLLDTESVIQMLILPLLTSSNTKISSTISVFVDRLLMGDGDKDVESIPIDLVLNLADDFTLPFCQVKLASIFIPGQSIPRTAESAEDADMEDSRLLQAFDIAIDSAVAARNTAWTCIIPLLDISIARHLRQRAESQFVAIFPSAKGSSATELHTLQGGIEQATNLLYIIDATVYSISNTASTPSLAPEIVSMLNSTWYLLSSSQASFQDVKEVVITKWLPLLLSFATVHISSFGQTKAGHEHRSKALLALAAIILELQARDDSMEGMNAIIEETFDLALHLIDALPGDMRQQCTTSLREVSNRRISYLFSITKDPSDWLVLSQKERINVSGTAERRATVLEKEKLAPYPLRRWEMLGEPTPNIGENDTSLSLTLFGARKFFLR